MLNRLFNAKGQWRIYLLEIVLIVLSVLLAIQADRYNQQRKKDAKLEAYVKGLYQDLKDEQFSNHNNLADCNKDIADIEACIRLAKFDQNDSLNLALDKLGTVFTRGVFRAFPPTTFDIMTYSGDIALIEDLAFRKRLAAAFAFRDNYTKQELKNYDVEIQNMARQMSRYLDFTCMASTNDRHRCLVDREGFVADHHNDLFLFLQTARNRAFHLQVGIGSFEHVIKELEQLYGPMLTEQ
jgi:hypothetical protein